MSCPLPPPPCWSHFEGLDAGPQPCRAQLPCTGGEKTGFPNSKTQVRGEGRAGEQGGRDSPQPILAAVPRLPSAQDRRHRGQRAGTGVTAPGAEAEQRCLGLRY